MNQHETVTQVTVQSVPMLAYFATWLSGISISQFIQGVTAVYVSLMAINQGFILYKNLKAKRKAKHD